jgi:hypothetical protein
MPRPLRRAQHTTTSSCQRLLMCGRGFQESTTTTVSGCSHNPKPSPCNEVRIPPRCHLPSDAAVTRGMLSSGASGRFVPTSSVVVMTSLRLKLSPGVEAGAQQTGIHRRRY